MLHHLVDYVVEKILYYWLLVVYGPLYICFVIILRIKLTLNKLKKRFGIGDHAFLSPLSAKSKVYDIGKTSTEEEIDFLTHRSLPYIIRVTLWTAKEVAKLFLRCQKVKLISDEQLIFVLTNTVFALDLQYDKNIKMFVLNLEELKQYTLFEGFYWDARKVTFNVDTNKIRIEMENGEEYSSDCVQSKKADYQLAKLHLQICLTFYGPGLEHNYVHFVFPSSMCIYAKQLLDKDKVLYKLLAPHFRFMERLNYQALRISHAASNTRSLFERLLCHWKSFPITKEQFIGSIERRLKEFFIVNGSRNCLIRGSYNEEDSLSARNLKKDLPFSRDHWLFPPMYTTEKAQQEIPYINFLTQYYKVIESFVAEMEPHIDRQEWLELSHTISRHVPRFEYVSFVDAVTTFIHTVSVQHSADHLSYLQYFARDYGCLSMRTKFQSFSNTTSWRNVTGPLCSLDDVKSNVTSLVKPMDVLRTRCFLNVFVDFIPSPSCDLSLMTTDYGFSEPKLKASQRKLKSGLRALDGNLMNQKGNYHLPHREDEQRCRGMQIIKLKELVRSNCF